MNKKRENLPPIRKLSPPSFSPLSALSPIQQSFPSENQQLILNNISPIQSTTQQRPQGQAYSRPIRENGKKTSPNQDSSFQSLQSKKKKMAQKYQDCEIQNRKYIQDKMQAIHKKISRQLVDQSKSQEKHKFKLFRDVIQTRKDIDRIHRQRRFIKSQNAKHLYEQPKMPPKSKPSKEYRLYTQIYQNQLLNRKAKQFSTKIQKQHEELLGRCLLRKQREDRKRQLQYQRDIARKKLIKQIMIGETRMYRYKDSLFANSRVLKDNPYDEGDQNEQSVRKQDNSQLLISNSGTQIQSLKLKKKYSQIVNSHRTEQTPVDLNISVNRRRSSTRATDLLPIEDYSMSHRLSFQLQSSNERANQNSKK